ncbi:MAG: LON peptidase substrate-binding domain-containing protein [Verrucomicrobia bacterium]|nr:LON peptidase substrate-binding domain-containing protein [Verrucomicrobiota bacterium]
MKPEIELPSRIPVMTLPEVAFFPNVMMPLYIFEPRYRAMLQTSLKGKRMFAVAGIDNSKVGESAEREPAHSIASVGVIRGCRTQEDGTSQLILQGLSRIRLDQIYEDKLYREADITPLLSTQKVEQGILMEMRSHLLALVKRSWSTNPELPRELLQLVEGLGEPEEFVDLVTYSLVQDSNLKQAALATLPIEKRYDLLIEAFSD